MWFYLGPVGDLRAVPPVERDQTVDVEEQVSLAEHRSLEGAGTQDRMGRVRNVWTIPWPYLAPPDVRELDAMRRGLLGGPLWLIDPLEPNLAPTVVATCGTEGKTPTGWAAESGSRTWVRVGLDRPLGIDNVGAIEWSRSTIADTLSVGRDTATQRVPLLSDGSPVACGAWLRRTSLEQMSLTAGLDWFDGDGNRQTTTASAVTLTTPGQWTRVVCPAVPPAGAVSVAPSWSIAAGEAASTIQINAVALGYGTTPPTHSPGGGAARVFIRALAKTYDDDQTITANLTVVES